MLSKQQLNCASLLAKNTMHKTKLLHFFMNLAALIKETISSQQHDNAGESDIIDEELENIMNCPPPQYDDKEYWDLRYERDPESFEWFQPWSRIKSKVIQYLQKDGQVLNVGCGNSTLPIEMLSDFNGTITNIDFSSVVINQMKKQYESEKRLVWVNGDCMSTPFENESFDFVIEKGTIDSFVCTLESTKKIPKIIEEIYRVMKHKAYLIVISYGTPSTRNTFFKSSQFDWCLQEVKEIEKINEPGTFHYVYIWQKN